MVVAALAVGVDMRSGGRTVPADLERILADLSDETGALDALLGNLEPAGWNLPTPAPGWSIGDQVSHLSFFDEAAVKAATIPEVFRAEADALMEHGADFAAAVATRFRSLSGLERLDWFRTARRRLLSTFGTLDATTRIPWYGPEMSVASAATARLMETWAHGQDVADALGLHYPATTRLQHIAHLGVRTFGFAFQLRGLEVPTEALWVTLTAPDGTVWGWGEPNAAECVSGAALDFCLVVTQRRHRDDTDLVTTGPVGARWLALAQAYAGPPGGGRPPQSVPPL
jgi:uncharacterized protein (TIGR03084 family)